MIRCALTVSPTYAVVLPSPTAQSWIVLGATGFAIVGVLVLVVLEILRSPILAQMRRPRRH